MITEILNRITGLIKRCYVTLVGDDNAKFQTTQVKYLGKTANVEVLYPYGLCGNPPTNSIAILFNIQGQEENRAGLFNLPNQRFNGLKEGEVVVGNYLSGSYIKFTQNGDIEILSTSNNIIITGNITVNGSITSSGNVIGGGISLDTHVHGGIVPGSSDTTGPI